MNNYYRETMHTPIGWMTISASSKGIKGISLLQRIVHNKKTEFPKDTKKLDLVNAAKVQLLEYFDGSRTSFELALDMEGTPFQQKVWQALLTIPYAHTSTYGDIAEKAGNPNAYRAVGQACGANPTPIIVPCHRILTSNGSIGGYSGGTDIKRWLLQHESSNIM